MILAVLLIPNTQLCLSSPGGSEHFQRSLMRCQFTSNHSSDQTDWFLPRALQATRCSSAIQKNTAEPAPSCLATSQDGGSGMGRGLTSCLPQKGIPLCCKLELVSKWKSPEKNGHNKERSSGLQAATPLEACRVTLFMLCFPLPPTTLQPDKSHCLQSWHLMPGARGYVRNWMSQPMKALKLEGRSKTGMGSSSPRRQPYSPSHQPQGEWAETLIPGLLVACFEIPSLLLSLCHMNEDWLPQMG